MKYRIQITKPCNEKWNEMTPTEKGAFCSKCKKEIFDFTNTSNYQIAKLLDNNQNLCGKFKPEQLNTDILSSENMRYTKKGLFFGLSALLSLTMPVFGQSSTQKVFKTEQAELLNNKLVNTKQLTDSIQLKGNISDDLGGLPAVSVFIKGYPYKTETDFDGNFSLTIDKKLLKYNLTLVISATGLYTKEIAINENTEFLNVIMKEEPEILGGVGIIVTKKKNIFRRIGNLFRKKR